MSLNDAQAKLGRAAKDLRAHWQVTRESWRDARAREVDERVIGELMAATKAASDAMTRLGEAVANARRDCSDPR